MISIVVPDYTWHVLDTVCTHYCIPNCFLSCSGNIQDVGILVGSVPADQVTKEEKKQIYKIYRFLNAVHIMCYKSFMRDEFKNDDSVYSQLIEMDLLTEEEGIRFGSMGKKVREGLCSRILCEIDVLLSLTTKKYAESKSIVLNDKICDLRGTMAKLHDTFVRGRLQNDCYL